MTHTIEEQIKALQLARRIMNYSPKDTPVSTEEETFDVYESLYDTMELLTHIKGLQWYMGLDG